MARWLLVGEGGSLDPDSRAVVDLGGVDFLHDLLLVEMRDVGECGEEEQRSEDCFDHFHTCYKIIMGFESLLFKRAQY